MITNDTIKTFRNYDFVLTPVGMDKKPETKNGKWHYDWTDTELLQAQRIGAYHKKSRIYDVDFDDKTFTAHKFIDLLPPTLTIGKKVNGRVIATHKIYSVPEGKKAEQYAYPSAASKGETIIEVLQNTQTILAGVDRVIINNVKPLELDPIEVQQHCRMIAFFSECLKAWPGNTSGKRDYAHLRLAGALSRTNIPLSMKQEYVSKLCELTGDNEIKNRVDKLEYQEQQLADDKEVYGIKELTKYLDVELPSYDEIKIKDEKEKVDKTKVIAFTDVMSFLKTNYPKPNYIIEPLVSEQTINQIVGASGVGKTMLGLTLAGAIAANNGFLDMPSINGSRPVLYVEGELPASDVQIRIGGMLNKIKSKVPKDYFNVATLQQQLQVNNSGFTPIQSEQGLIMIENAIRQIKERTGKMPVVFIDNISCLAPGLEENDAAAWSPILNKFVYWKNIGCTVFYFHHLNKSGDASGSTMQHRTIDMVIRMRKPDHKQKIKTFEDKGVQAIVDFPKWRLHDNSKHAQEHMLICEDWNWQKLPILSSDEMEIIKMHNDGSSLNEMAEELGKNYKTISRKRKKLFDDGILKPNEQTTKEDKDVEDVDSEKENQKKFKKLFSEFKEGASTKHPDMPEVLMEVVNDGNKKHPDLKIVYGLRGRAAAYATLNQLIEEEGINDKAS